MAVKSTDAVFKQFGYWWARANKTLHGPYKTEAEAERVYKDAKRGKLRVVEQEWRP